MSKRKYSPKRDIQNAIKQLNSTSPTEICKWILNKYNISISPNSISMWKRRNPDIIEKLEREFSNKTNEIVNVFLKTENVLKISEKQKVIWECLEKGESQEEIMQKTKCTERYYYKVLKKYKNRRSQIIVPYCDKGEVESRIMNEGILDKLFIIGSIEQQGFGWGCPLRSKNEIKERRIIRRSVYECQVMNRGKNCRYLKWFEIKPEEINKLINNWFK